MYHCHIHFFLVGVKNRAFEIIKEMSPFEHFTHEFSEGIKLETPLISKADVIFAYLQDMDVGEALQTLVTEKKGDAELILLANKEQVPLVSDYLSEIKDIWTMSMEDEEIRFRFFRWQQDCKLRKDFWQTEQYLEAVINNTPNMIWYKDKEGIHKKVNDSFCKTVNKTKQQVEGRTHAYIWDVEEDDPACIESELEVMNKRETCVSGEVIKTGEGTRMLTTYKSPLYDLDGSVMGTVGVAIDVTQERNYEAEIIKKNRILEVIFTGMDCGVMCHTLDGTRLIRINKAALRILGYRSQDELMSKGFDMVASSVMEQDKPKILKAMEELKKEGDSVTVEYRVQHDSGEILHVMGNIKLMKENGELFYQRFLLDCTTQKIKEHQERSKKDKHHMELIQALGIDYNLVCYFDLDTGAGMPLRIDDEYRFMFDSAFLGNISLEESLEFYIQKFVYEDDREMLRQAFRREWLKEELTEKKLYYVNYRTFFDNEMKYYQVRVVPAGVWEGNQGIVIGFRSVDEEIRNEMEKKNMLEEALLQANKANKAKSAFLSNMSHDIRTPMNAIVGFTSLALSHIDNKEQIEEYLKKIMASGNHLLSLINDVLDMSRIESGKIQLEEKPCSLKEILHGLRNILQADVLARQLELHIDSEDVQHEEFYCDKLRLNQVLLNLLSNSVKYTNEGGIVSMKVKEKSGVPAGHANYEFCVEDNGNGMSEEFVSHIFEPFEREKNSTISGIQGTGLGMAITKNIVDMMGGSIEVKSEQGIGTKVIVSVTFRLHLGEKISTEERKEKKSGKESEKHLTGRILLAEDVELNQEIAVAILGDAGFDTDVARNGQIAVEMLRKSKPGYYKLVLMDVQMPVMNGYEATKAIRKLDNKELATIPIIAMTANAFEEDRQEALKCGMNGHIAKPIDVEKLFDTLEKILD
ncbi:MAG: response regulator [Lachnospiraceae bacterium]|nr:response regulator [Lachnospiraceae bacterium]